MNAEQEPRVTRTKRIKFKNKYKNFLKRLFDELKKGNKMEDKQRQLNSYLYSMF